MTNNLESYNDKLSIDHNKELSSSRPLCNTNDVVPENCKNEDMYNASNISDPCDTLSILNKLKFTNINRLVIGQLNFNSLNFKFCRLKLIIEKNIDTLVTTKSKLDSKCSSPQFKISGFSMQYKCDRNRLGEGVIVYVRNDIPNKQLSKQI